MGNNRSHIRSFIGKIELFEWIGIGASLIWVALYYLLAPFVDTKEGIPGWHNKPLVWIWNVYRDSIPTLLLWVALLLLAIGWLKKRQYREAFIWAWKTFLTYIRLVFPFCCLLIVYRLVNFYIPVLRPNDQDQLLLNSDLFLFGQQPSIWLQHLIRPWLTDVMSFAYSSWFFLLFGTILLLQLKSRTAVRGYLISSLMSFYLGYIGYLIVPAVGPYYTLANHYTIALSGGVITSLQESIVHQDLSVPRDCFPSLHTAISCVMLFYVSKFHKKWAWFYGPMVVTIILSTVYLRWHYATDVIAGILLAAITCYIGQLLTAEKRHPEYIDSEIMNEVPA